MDKESLYSKLLKYCSYQERCVADIHQFIAKYVVPGEWREELVDRLKEDNYLNEARFAGAYARGHFRQKKWGRNKITQALKLKGLEDSSIYSGLDEIPETEYEEVLKDLLLAKKRTIKDKDPYMVRNKLARFAMTKGFEPDMVWEQIKKGLQ